MKSLKIFALLAFALAAVLSVATAVQAKPLYCELQCTSSTPCSTFCTDRFGEVGFPGEIITCSEWGICNWGGFTQAAISSTTTAAMLFGGGTSQCIPGETATTPVTTAQGATIPTPSLSSAGS